ncbi:hypothetical protein PRIPAC_82730 [Pristionchus pacificus]|uniref:G protein-coupled receptor n=1 Tax=Pristionchus pacificus TaxID=54126 RepID=A0A2A6CQ94_PRIPA|nr:hypothetical protein PRIPAC_82730 [Pristionchus pacificus]|eukprot:PDM80382.1 G protein-coupled receptor [Pristionchus pacificus]
MDDFEWTKGNHIAAAILFPLALFGFTCNLCVVVFLNSMPSLNNSFGSLTLSQAIVDSIHQLLLAFFLAPTIYFQNPDMYDISHQFGYATLLAYEICCFSHVCISVNRFTAVCVPLAYGKLFSKTNTRIIIASTWILAIGILTYMLQILDCDFYLPTGTWIYTFRDNVVCTRVKWYGDFSLNCLSVVIVAVLDVSSIARLHCINERHNLDALSAQKRSRQIVLVYQAALQGILFITELITYFLLSGFARNKWEAYALTTISWCLVNGADGFQGGERATPVSSVAHRNDTNTAVRSATTASSIQRA